LADPRTLPDPLSFKENLGEEYYQSMPTLAGAMSQVLRWFDCREIYGVAGDYAASLIRALESSFELCPSSNETHAGFSACASAELHGIGCCLVTYTVGSLPCLTAAALAMAERLPVVFISGAPAENELHAGGLHHTLCRSDSWSLVYDNALAAFAALGARAERLQGARNRYQPNLAGEQFLRLVAHAFLHREPVLIEVPRDLVFEKTQTVRLEGRPEDISDNRSRLDGARQIADHVERKLRSARRPLVYLGEKFRLNPALQQTVLRFCRKLDIPFVSNIYAKGVFADDDPLSLGTYNGVFTRARTRRYIELAVDFVLEVGTSTYTQDVSNALNTGTNAIENFPNKVAIIGSSVRERDEQTLFELLLERDLPRFETVLPPEPPPRPLSNEEPIGWHNLIDLLDQVQAAEDRAFVYLPEVGSAFFSSFTLPTRRSRLGRSWLTNPWYGAMGTTLPYARAVCRTIGREGCDDIPIVLIGDGGFHFQLNELVHFQREELSVIILLLRNDQFYFGRSSGSRIYECSAPEFDALKLVEAYGGQGWSCSTVGELRTHLSRCAREPRGIQLIEARVDTTEAHQSNEIRIFNTYIRAKAGCPEDIEAWNALIRRADPTSPSAQ
jgi:thiamine pyrophosphate-dependent acetolactate synthase large subunit-like protein